MVAFLFLANTAALISEKSHDSTPKTRKLSAVNAAVGFSTKIKNFLDRLTATKERMSSSLTQNVQQLDMIITKVGKSRPKV